MKFRLGSLSKVLRYALIPVPAGIFLERMWQTRWIGDDGLINIRVVHNILAGFGPVYNAGERVEAFTSPLWIWILSLFGLIGFPPDTVSVYLGLVFSFSGLCLSCLGSIKLSRAGNGNPSYAVPAGMLVYTVIPAAWDYATSGLETGLSLAWLGGMFYFLSCLLSGAAPRDLTRSRSGAAYAAMLGLGPLIRPELSIFSFGLLLPLIAELLEANRFQQFIRTVVAPGLRFGLLAAVLPVGYQLFRMGYYAAFTSNTAIAKEAFIPNWEQGWFYFDNFFKLYDLGIPLLVLFAFLTLKVGKSKRWAVRTALILPVLCSIAYTLSVVKIGGDFMHGRFFLPAIFGGLMPVFTIHLETFVGHRAVKFVALGLILVLVGWSVYCASSLRMPIENQNGIGDERGWYTRRSVTPNPTRNKDYRKFSSYRDAKSIRKLQKRDCPSKVESDQKDCSRYLLLDTPRYGNVKGAAKKIPIDSSNVSDSTQMIVMRDGIGIFGTKVGHRVHVVDRYGLADPIGARMLIKQRGRPGHEKQFSYPWMVARFADSSQIEDRAVGAAAAALSCPPLSDLIEAVSAPLTFARFRDNVFRSFEFQKLRIPPNPFKAEKLFCQ